MIKVLHILWSAHFGGIERLVFDLASAQMAVPEMEVGVVFGRGEGEFLEKFLEVGLKCRFLNLSNGFDISPWKYFRALRIMREYDILHFHGFNPFVAMCGFFSGKRVIYTEHGNFGYGRKAKFSDPIKAALLRRFLNLGVDYITFNSLFTKSIAQRRYRLNDIKMSVVHNGISFNNTSSLEDIEVSLSERIRDKFVIGTTSRFAGFKRIDRLIRAFSIFHKNADCVLLLVGDGVLRNELERLINNEGLSEKAIFAGYRSNIRAFQDLMDICVFPSESEPFGLVAVETLSLGKPTIVFKDGGGIVEIVGGFCQDDVVKDIPQLVERLEYYYRNKSGITNCYHDRISYARRFDISKMAKQLLDIYKALTDGRKN